jgi:hypothetical protein
MERRMAGVQQPVEVACAPVRDQVDPDVQCRSDCANGMQGQQLEMSSLEAADGRRRHAGQRRDIALTQPSTDSHRASDGPEPKVVHTPSLPAAA